MGSVETFNVTLQLDRGGELAEAVLTGSVEFPAVTFLLLKLQMVPHVGHTLDIRTLKQLRHLKAV